MEQKISVVINTYNAEEKLARVLDTVKDFDEIVVCDMESTDSTVDIARKYGCKVITFPKGNHKSAEPARQFANQSATYSWLLVVDADELVPKELKDYLYDRISKPDCPQGIYIPRKNYFMGELDSYPDYQLRFFVKEGSVWPPYVHTFPIVNGVLEHIDKRRKELALIHIANDSIGTRLRKANEYTDNEIYKRQDEKVGALKLVYAPLWRFIHLYIVKGGFRHGIPGLIIAVLNGFYKFVTIAKIIEARNKDKYKKE